MKKSFPVLCSAVAAVQLMCAGAGETPGCAGLFAREFSILVMGDLMVTRGAEILITQKGPDWPFRKLESEFKKYDCVFGNLEVSVTNRGRPEPFKAWVFRLNPENAVYMKTLKIDVLSIANNHLLDYGLEGMEDTIAWLDGWGVAYCGAGKNLAEARKPARYNARGTDVFFFAYCDRPPESFYAKAAKPGIAKIDLAMIAEDIRSRKKENNLVCVSLHWGIELEAWPGQDQIDRAHAIIDAGADCIIGHHPHVPQGIEIYKGRPIIYSLGNTVSGYYNSRYRNNFLAVMRCRGSAVERLEIIPIAGRNEEMMFQPYVLSGAPANATLAHISDISKKFNTSIKIEAGRGFIEIKPPNAP